MHPAKSVIFFTTISGAGFGLIALLSLALCFGMASFDTAFYISAIIAVLLSSAGLISSTFHLGNPQRAWRAFSQYQSSWLSREGVLSVLTLGCFVLWIGSAYITGGAQTWIGALVALLCGLTIYATAMIYAQLKPVPRWHSRLTPASYLGFGLSSGMLLFAAILPDQIGLGYIGMASLILAWGIKMMWWQLADKTGRDADGSSLATATGLTGYASVKLFEAPHLTKNYLMKEMVFEIGRKHAAKLRWMSMVLGFVLPLIMLVLAGFFGAPLMICALIAFAFHMAGLFVERWLFFAEAEHVVALYYGK
ncbi:MAG: dimethyl sulfoxide reductase anchor subunit family protein [Candidatus Puniceispirillaceae bacterium]